LPELIGIVKNFILDALFCKPKESEVAWTQVCTIVWLLESHHLQGLDFGDTISCWVNTALSM
jgi:hypothetical protein